LVIDAGADWTQTLMVQINKILYKPDFIDILEYNKKDKIIKYIIEKYPEKYKEYLMKNRQ
jgi:hypothetical protein